MLLLKTAIWSLMYPTIVAAYAAHTIFMWVKFLFNSPVDVWTIISTSIEEAMKEP